MSGSSSRFIITVFPLPKTRNGIFFYYQEIMGCDMAKEVVVTRRGQTTIPMEIRKKLGIKEGSRLRAHAEGDRVILTKVPSVFDLAGTSKLTKEEAFKLLDKMRAED
jgi:AbrB family looped-hinge helix DNA binding protein